MRLPPHLHAVLCALRSPGRPRLVGGCVRDWLLGLEPKDFDVEVPGLSFEELHRRLSPFGSTDIVGRSFGVIKLRLEGVEYDFSLPRRESKTGAGHRGFAVEADPELTDAEAAARRDFTVNSIAYDPFDDALIDPHEGQVDLHRRILRHTSPAFVEDPLRVLRGFQLAGRFSFDLAPETVVLCRSIKDSFAELPVERIWGEWAKWAEKSEKPSKGLEALKQTGWLDHFPEIAALDGTPQDPEWHPEGDVFTHTKHCCDSLVYQPRWRQGDAFRRRVLMLATLCHDLGKPTTTEQTGEHGKLRWTSRGHDSVGVPIAALFLARIGAPRDVQAHVPPLVGNHHVLYSTHNGLSSVAVRRLARRLTPATIADLCSVMQADHDGRPPLSSSDNMHRLAQLMEEAEALSLRDKAPQPILLGRHLIELGYEPGPGFKSLLDEGFEAQLEGAFYDEVTAKMWVQQRLSSSR